MRFAIAAALSLSLGTFALPSGAGVMPTRARAGQADMAVSVFKGPANGLGKAIAHPVVGQRLLWGISITNNGPDNVDLETITIQLPSTVSFQNAAVVSCAVVGTTLTCTGHKALAARRGAVLRPRAPSGRGRDVHAHADRDEPADRSRLEQQLEEHHDDRHGRGFARCAPPQSQEAACRTPFHRLGGRGAGRGWTGGCGLLGQGWGTPPVVARQAVRWSACDLHVVHSRALPRSPSRRAGQRHPRAYRRGPAPLPADPLELSRFARARRFSPSPRERSSPRVRARSLRLARPRPAPRSAAGARTRRAGGCASSRGRRWRS